MKFTHLHVHSHYSLLDGLPKIDELLDYVKELGMDSVALTDHGVLYGAVEFFKKAKARGIKPILGCEIYSALEKMDQKRPNIDDKRYHLILLVKNEEGYKNLVQLITKAHLEGFYYKPRIDDELLAKHSAGLIGLSACLQGKIPRLIVANRLEDAKKQALKYQEIFGKDSFYLEIQDHPRIPEQKKVNDVLINFSKELKIPLVATNDSHYLKPEDAETQDILMLINTGADKDDPERLTMKTDDFSLKSPAEMERAFGNVPEAIENTQKIAELCNFQFELGKTKLPLFEVPNGKTPDEYLEELCEQGVKNRFGENPKKEVIDRLNYELSVIKQTGFASYFLIVQDFVNWAKSNRIVVGPGRGCFLPGTKILLKNGRQKNIEDIKLGERVITHLGNKRKVKKVLSYDINEEIAVIKSKMPAFELKLTRDHKVLVVRHQMCAVKTAKETICKPTCNRSCRKKLWKKYKLEWVKAQNLKKNDLMVYPIPKRRKIKTTFDLLNLNNLDSHLKGDNKYVWYEIGTNKIIPKKIKRFINLDEKLAQLLGFYISEGWPRLKRENGGVIGFGFHKKERKNVKEVRELLKEIFGLKSSVKFHKTKNSCQVFGYSRIVAKFFERLCGKYAINKHIPYEVFENNDKIIVSLLTTLFKGDGSHKDTMRISFDSISFDLVSQVKMLLSQLGIMSSIKTRNPKNKNWHINYKLTVSGKQLFKFNKLFPEFQIPIRKQKFYRNDTFIQQNYIWFPVKEIVFENYKGKVYDLTVEKDTSYIANEITVHNSVGGSLVAYLTNITNVDPLKHNLLFERFLNPGRTAGLPDIDLDFTDRRRNEVINYIAQKYGKDHVAQIITFGTMASRAVIRDVGRALAIPYSYCDKIAKMIPFGFTLEETLKKVSEFKEIYESDDQAKKLIDLAKNLEGVARHASTHACGVVISKNPLTDYVPLQHPTQDDENIVTQYEMHAIEDLGLLKMDLLGLKNLTIIEDCLVRIYEVHKQSINIDTIPSDDEKTYKLFREANTVGVFQLESSGIQAYLKQLKPTTFEDIVAMVALYRPGPIRFIPDFIKGKNKKKKIEYLHPKLEPILKTTYGICVTGDSYIQTANPGGILQIDKIINSSKQLSVQSFTKKGFEKKNIIHKFDNDIKSVYKIILRTGKQIKATANHQFLTTEGWKKLRELKEGDFLATPKKLFSGKRKFNIDKLRVLAYLIADGSLTSGVSCYFVNKNLALLKDFKKSAESSFKNLKIVFTKHIRNVQRANPSKIDNSGSLYHQPNTLLKWLRELGLKSIQGGKKSNKKFIPPFIFELNKESISIFLAAYWDCDGGIAQKMAYLTTISEKLSFNVQTLLLKLGINSYIYQTEKYISRYNEQMKVYRIVVYDLNDFYKKVGRLMITNKRKLLIQHLNKVKHEDCKEFVPRERFFIKVVDYSKTNHITQRTICKYLKIERKGFFGRKEREKIRLNLVVAKKIANFLKDKELKKICDTKSIRWEDIISIRHEGKKHVYDLEIEGTHNFIANNIISHNCVYQEQLMEIAKQLAGFTLAEADVLRKAVGKKIKELLRAQEEKFITGCIKNGVRKEDAQKIWQWILPFAEYGFNKSHSVAYATIAYQTAYLKAHYPVEFMAALLTSEKADIERIAVLIKECKKIGISVLPPDVNESFRNFSVVPQEHKIRFGLLAIKNVGENVVEAIISERKIGGHFKSIQDFISRIQSKTLNKKSMESLIKAGVFDRLEERNKLLHNLEDILEANREIKQSLNNGQKNLFENCSNFNHSAIRLKQAEAISLSDQLNWEKELLGLYVSAHPLDNFKTIFEKKAFPINNITSGLVGKTIRVGGIISGIKRIITRSGKPMLFMGLEDLTNKIEIVVFPSIIDRNPTVFQENKIVFVKGRVDNRDNVPKIICEEIEEVIES